MKKIIHEYINTICSIYPNLGTVFGLSYLGYNNFSLEGKKHNIDKLESLKLKIKEHEDEYEKNIMTTMLDKSIYELKSIYSFTAYYYYSMTIQSFLILFRNYKYYTCGIDKEVLISRVNQFPEVINKFKTEVNGNSFSYIDLLYTLSLIKKDLYFIKYELIKILSKTDYEIILSETQSILEFISKKIKRSSKTNLFIDWEKEDFINYIDLMSEYNVDSIMLEKLYKAAIHYVDKNSQCNIFNYQNDIDKKKINIFSIKELLYSVFSESNYIFGDVNDMFENLNIIDLNNSNFYFGEFQYLPSYMNDTKNGACILFSSNNIKSSKLLKLKIIHEIYPGHHFSYSKQRSNLLNKITKNMFLEEGWAKYCEFLFAFEIDNSYEMKQAYKIKHLLSSINFIITMNIHYYDRKLSEIFDLLMNKCGLDKHRILSLIMQCNVQPLSSINYFVGFHVVKTILANKKTDNNMYEFLVETFYDKESTVII